MALKEILLAEFEQEMATTRRTLERVPEDRSNYQPHAKSMTLARLAGHVAELPIWGLMTIAHSELDLAPPGGKAWAPAVMKSRAELLAFFDKNVAETRAALAATSDDEFSKPWTLMRAGQTLMTIQKMACWRSFVLNHLVHHRAQLGVYLRLNDVPLPSVYGPSADEQPFAFETRSGKL
jgi:uncharacterized damage-inducible protein DinB